MHISRIELINFRNHQHLVLGDIKNVLVIVGENAVGKTNVIEALQLLSMHESFRKPKNFELAYKQKEEKEPTLIKVDLLALESNNTKQISFFDTTRAYSYNKKERPAKELIDLLPAVLFTPDDLQIIKGPPEQRRDMIDSLGMRLSHSFAHIRAEYYKALKHKNSLLRQEEVERDLLDSWNINLAKLGNSLVKHRIGLFEQLLEFAAERYSQISGGEELEGEYVFSWKDSEEKEETDLYEVFLQQREAEIAARRARFGPHKDDISFTIDTNDTRRFASQGQQRSVALALKMAEIEILRRVKGKEPLLLLDDVMSELDVNRRNYFVDLISEAGQTVITTTNLGYFSEEFLSRATVVELKQTMNKNSEDSTK